MRPQLINLPANSGSEFRTMVATQTLEQFFRFVVVGCANTAVGLCAILFLRYGLEVNDLLANLLGYAVGIALSFVLNRNFTFSDRGALSPALVRFAISAAIAYLVNLAVLIFFLRVIDAGSLVSQIAGIVSYTIAFFLLAKLFAFKEGRAAIARAQG